MQPTILLSDQEFSDKALNPLAFETAKALFQEHGFLKIGNLFPKEWIEGLAAALSSQLQYDPEKMTLKSGVRIHRGRYIVPIPLSPPFDQAALYANPVLLSLMKEFLGSDCILSGLGAVVSLPGAPDQHIHADFEPLFKEQPFLNAVHAPYAITVGIPLVDIDAVNGPTKIWSGTHLAPHADKKTVDEFYERHFLHGQMGSCYFWDYRTLHAGGSNHSESLRPLLYLSYTRHWFRDQKNPDKLIMDDREIAEEHRSLFPKPLYWDSSMEAEFQSKVEALFQPSTEKE